MAVPQDEQDFDRQRRGSNETKGEETMNFTIGKSKVVAWVAALGIPLALAMALGAPLPGRQSANPATKKAGLTEFDAPGAATASSPFCGTSCGTVAYDNNDFGVIVGYYTDTNVVPHGFLRLPNGHVTSFDAPGAGLGADLNQGTAAYAINDFGVIAGQFQDSNYLYHGFVRYPNGSFTTFVEPDAGTVASQATFVGTLAFDVNLFGTTAGIYVDAGGVQHGFVRSPWNDFTSFDPTGSVFTYVCEETCLSPDGTVAGFYSDSSGVTHGFVRQANGAITSFDAPAPATLTTILTVAASINPQGVIAGYFVDSNFMAHGFLRYPNGSFTAFDDPKAGPVGTIAYSINLSGATTGQYVDASDNEHGFESFPDGQFANFDAPGAAPSIPPATRPSTNNAEGEVAGWYIDAGGLNHGFLWLPGIGGPFVATLQSPAQRGAVSSPDLTVRMPEAAGISMQRKIVASLVISRLRVPERVREALLKHPAFGEQ
jgi:hypothetical protein